MSVWQIIIAVAYVVAVGFAAWAGRPAPLVWAICAANFAGSMAFKGDLVATGVVDALTFALLVAEASPMSLALAFCFGICIMLDWFGLSFGIPIDTTAAIVDFMIIPIALIIGCLDGGGGNLSRALGGLAHSGAVARYFNSWTDLPLENWRHATVDPDADKGVVAKRGVGHGGR